MADNFLTKPMFLSETVKHLHDLFTGIWQTELIQLGTRGSALWQNL